VPTRASARSKQQAADQAHLRFRVSARISSADRAVAILQRSLATKSSHRNPLAQCRAHFVSFLRLNEWRDVYRQL
jgi:ATP-dependent helicase HrpA